jgi:diphthamide synthase (EF-2-diphthine--ammonia ligase)
MLTLSTKQRAYTDALDQLPMVQRNVADVVRKLFSSEFAETLICVSASQLDRHQLGYSLRNGWDVPELAPSSNSSI